MRIAQFSCFAVCAAFGVSGCLAPSADEEIGSTRSALSTLQVTDVANLYNVGVADGFVLSFTSWPTSANLTNAQTSFGQEKQFWPGGPLMNNAGHGSSITTNGLPLPTFWLTMPASFTAAQANHQSVDNTLATRTTFAGFYELGSSIAAAEAQANFAFTLMSNGDIVGCHNSYGYSKANLRDAIAKTRSLCAPGANATTFDAASLQATYDYYNQSTDYCTNTGSTDLKVYYMWKAIQAQRNALGSVVSDQSKLRSGIAGPGC